MKLDTLWRLAFLCALSAIAVGPSRAGPPLVGAAIFAVGAFVQELIGWVMLGPSDSGSPPK